MKRKFLTALMCLAVLIAIGPFVSNVIAQTDAVFKFKKNGGATKISGSVTEVTPQGVTIQTKSGTEKIAAADIKKVTAKGEPTGLERARDRIETGRLDDALEELAKCSDGGNPLVKAELDYLKAYANSKIALQGGNITAKQAGQSVGNFLSAHPKSHHVFPATELMGHLAVAAGPGSLDYANQKYEALTGSNWPEYTLKGFFYQGETLIKQQKYAEAISSFDQIINVNANDDLSQQYKLLAKCEKAKAQGLIGGANVEAAIGVIEGIIRDENPDNAELFAYAYNARGAIQLKANQINEACESYLFTDLLFSTQIEPHAEAVFNLAKIWQQLEETDRSNESRETLKGRYRNSFWATQL